MLKGFSHLYTWGKWLLIPLRSKHIISYSYYIILNAALIVYVYGEMYLHTGQKHSLLLVDRLNPKH